MNFNNHDRQDRLKKIILREVTNRFELYNNEEHKLRYRFSKESAFFVCDMVRDILQRPKKHNGAIPVELHVDAHSLGFMLLDIFRWLLEISTSSVSHAYRTWWQKFHGCCLSMWST